MRRRDEGTALSGWRIGRAMAALFVVCLSSACGDGGSGGDGGWRGSIDTLANGVVHVRNDHGAWTDAERWRIVVELRIGRIDGGGPDQFGSIVAVTGGPAGEILVADGASQDVRVFDRDGVWLRTLGGKGSGPGELRGVSGLAFDERGTLWIADPGNARYALFDSTGAHIEEVPMRTPGAVLPWLGGFGDDGYLYDAAARVEPGDVVAFRYYRLDPTTGAVLDTLPPMRYHRPQDVPGGLFRLLPRLTFRLDPAGSTWFGTTDAMRLVHRALDGDTLQVIEWNRVLAAIGDAQKDSIMRQQEDDAPAPEERFGRRDIPGHAAAFDRIYVDGRGHVIVQPNVGPGEDGAVFDVFDSDGRYLGEMRSDIPFVTFPALPVFDGDVAYGVVADSIGATWAVRARITKPARAPAG